MWKCFLGKRTPMFFMRWKNFAKLLAQFTFEIRGVFFLFWGCFVWFLKVLHMISALEKKNGYLLLYHQKKCNRVNTEYLIFIGQILNLIWSFPNKSSVWLYGKQLQLLCKTHIQVVFKIVLKNQCPRQSHNAKTTYWPLKTKILVNYFYIYISKNWIRLVTKTPFEALHNYFTTISDGLPEPFSLASSLLKYLLWQLFSRQLLSPIHLH